MTYIQETLLNIWNAAAGWIGEVVYGTPQSTMSEQGIANIRAAQKERWAKKRAKDAFKELKAQAAARARRKARQSSSFDIPNYRLLEPPIGRGAYGRVWIGISKTKSRHAVKIIQRSDFQSDRDYTREFKGITNFEPISRKHPGFVPLLHIGRNEKRGYYFYVMDLADDASGSRPKDYRPDSLSNRIRQRRRMNPATVLEIALTLAESVRFLHAEGLVHRDIKPANILFLHKTPRLSDVGLVALIDDTLTRVGTEGYYTRENAATPAGDVYALGQVIYEMLTGRRLPDSPDSLHSHEQCFQKLNEVVMRTCSANETDPINTAVGLLDALTQIKQSSDDSLQTVKEIGP